MAKPINRVLDVWITETQAVYTEVPFAVVTDWLQQGRLLADDRVRLAGNKTWHLVSKVPALAPYLPQAEPLETSSAAEAIEPVELGWNWKPSEESEDDDVDMIPLIDISLVLLIFFMMTATISSGMLATAGFVVLRVLLKRRLPAAIAAVLCFFSVVLEGMFSPGWPLLDLICGLLITGGFVATIGWVEIVPPA